MLRVIFVSLLVLHVVACSTKVAPVAYHCPQLQLPPDPVAATGLLNDESEPDEIIKAWVATAYAYRGWNLVVRKQVEDSK